jgi:hypothetical protein
LGVVAAVAVGLGAAAVADTFCFLGPLGFSVVTIDVTAQGHLTSRWSQDMGCSPGVSPSGVCYTCLDEELWWKDPATDAWHLVSAGGWKGSVGCNRSSTQWAAIDWGVWPPGQYDLRTILCQGGQCSAVRGTHDDYFDIPAPPRFGRRLQKGTHYA